MDREKHQSMVAQKMLLLSSDGTQVNSSSVIRQVDVIIDLSQLTSKQHFCEEIKAADDVIV